jgi:hypothetical protein
MGRAINSMIHHVNNQSGTKEIEMAEWEGEDGKRETNAEGPNDSF